MLYDSFQSIAFAPVIRNRSALHCSFKTSNTVPDERHDQLSVQRIIHPSDVVQRLKRGGYASGLGAENSPASRRPSLAGYLVIWLGLVVHPTPFAPSSEKYDWQLCSFAPAVTIIHLRINALIDWRSNYHLVLSKPFLQQKVIPTMTQVAKKILVTCALPYANGSTSAICWSTSG